MSAHGSRPRGRRGSQRSPLGEPRVPEHGSSPHRFVSFGLLDEKDERPERSFAFSLFDRMRHAFMTAPVPAGAAGGGEGRAGDTAVRGGARGRPPHRARRTREIMPLRTLPPSGSAAAPTALYALSRTDDNTDSLMNGGGSVDESEPWRSPDTTAGAFAPSDAQDDTRSFMSSATRRPRSDVADDSVSVMNIARPTNQGSADAWIRRFRGEGLSRRYWMADETAKECRECLMPFTRLRRRHHCRVCGQIFCNRCASNTISARRFGHSGEIRVCNQCLCMLQEYDRRKEIDAPHRRGGSVGSISSLPWASPSAAEPGEAGEAPAGTPASAPAETSPEAAENAPLSQFAAANLFSHDMAPATPASGSPHLPASPTTPHSPSSAPADTSATEPPEQAPFRPALDPEDAADVSAAGAASFSDAYTRDTEQEEPPPRSSSPPPSPALRAPRPQAPQIPLKLVEPRPTHDLPEEPGAAGILDMLDEGLGREEEQAPAPDECEFNAPPEAPRDAPNDALRRSPARGASHFVTSTALSAASLVHFSRMLQQLLLREPLGNTREWSEVIKLLALSVIERIQLHPRETYITDIRSFVKIKCIAGGRIGDCEYIDGYVCTKNVATKRMAGFLPLRNARIMTITFPLEYHRNENQLMSLEPIMAQEHEFIRILVARIMALRPNVVFAEKSVSYLALRLFEKAGVLVFWSMKRSSIEAISRCTQADIISSIDRLALDPRLGRCTSLSVETFEELHAAGRRKPLLKIQVAPRDLGGGLLLRGASPQKLRRVKAILTLMIFVAYNLKLEEYLRRDGGIVLDWAAIRMQRPALPPSMAPSPAPDSASITATLQKYRGAILSSSIPIVLPPPYLVTRMEQLDEELERLRQALAAQRAESAPDTYTYVPEAQPREEKDSDALSTRTASTHDKAAPAAPSSPRESEADTPPPDTPALPPPGPETPPPVPMQLRQPAYSRIEAEVENVEMEHENMLHWWHACIERTKGMLTPFAHQQILVLTSTTCMAPTTTCAGPMLQTLEFYGPEDVTLGQYLERTHEESAQACTAKGCEKPMLQHFKTYVHNGMRIQVFVERFNCPIPGEENSLLCWSYCKVCQAATRVARLSEESWSLSFAKYLELHCYPNPACHTALCAHDHYRDNVRYFAIQNHAIRFHADPIEPYEVTVPPVRLKSNAELLSELKNEETIALYQRNQLYWDSVVTRLENLREELLRCLSASPASTDERSQLVTILQTLVRQAQLDRRSVEKRLMQVYWASSARDMLPLNRVRRFLFSKVVEWDGHFVDLERYSSPSEKEIRRLTTSHLKRLFAERESEQDEAEQSEAAEKLEKDDAQRPPDETEEGLDEKRDTVPSIQQTTPEQTGPPSDVSRGSEQLVREPASTSRESSAAEKALHDVASTAIEAPTPTASPPPARGPTPPAQPKLSAPSSPAQAAVPAARSAPDSPRPASLGPPSPGTLPTEQKAPTPFRPMSAPRPSASLPVEGARQGKDPLPRTRSVEPKEMPRGQMGAGGLRLTKPQNHGPFAKFNHRGELILPPPSATDYARNRKAPGLERATTLPGNLPTRSRLDAKRHEPPSRTQVASIARQFERINQEAERERRMNGSRARRTRPLSTAQATVKVFKSISDAVGGDDSDSDEEQVTPRTQERRSEQRDAGTPSAAKTAPQSHAPGSQPAAQRAAQAAPAHQEAPADRPQPPSAPQDRGEPAATASETQPAAQAPSPSLSASDAGKQTDDTRTLSDVGTEATTQTDDEQASEASQAPDEGRDVQERTDLFKALAGIWSGRATELSALEYPFLSTDHIFSDSNVVVREDEPSSVIAFTLDSRSYVDQLQATKQPREQPAEAQDGRDWEHQLCHTEGTHYRYEFHTGSLDLWCKVFFVEQFDALRHVCNCGESIIESLSRCVKWDSSGGKSGSAFLKTRDDRLVVKQLSRAEMDGFSNFAPHYFRYLADCFRCQRPTTLAKIFGCFRIGFRNLQTGKHLKMDVVVMENLFYGQKVNKIFDLKGSVRNRLRQETGRANEVLLDENLVQMSHTSPLFVREHSKRILRSALYNDSLFLTDMNVMDYSLMVGLDETRHELVIGIIDFVRTYTWDKRVESFVKETAILGGGGRGEPTIITPRQYRMRFISFLDRMFLMTPDPWVQPGWLQ